MWYSSIIHQLLKQCILQKANTLKEGLKTIQDGFISKEMRKPILFLSKFGQRYTDIFL